MDRRKIKSTPVYIKDGVFILGNKKSRHLYITGPRSAGKTQLARQVATDMELAFYDLDHELNTKLRNYGGLIKVINSENWNLIDSNLKKIIEYFIGKKESFVAAIAGGIFEYEHVSDEIKRDGIILAIIPGSYLVEAREILVSREMKRAHFKAMIVKRKMTRESLRSKIIKDMNDSLVKIEDKADSIHFTGRKDPQAVVKSIFRQVT